MKSVESVPDGSCRQRIWKTGTLVYTASGLVALFSFLLIGDFVWSLKDRAIGTIALVLFKKFGASDFLNGLLIMSIPAALGLLVTPVVSYRSDRHRGRWGRRIPFLLITTPIAVSGMIGMAFSPTLGEYLSCVTGGRLTSNAATLFSLGTFWMLFEFSMVVAAAVFNAFINDVVPHQMLGRFYGAFRIISLGAGILFHYCLLGWAETHSLFLFLGTGIFYGVGMFLMCTRVHEGEYPPPSPLPASSGRPGCFAAIGEYFRQCFGSRYYLLLFITVTLFSVVFLPINTYCIFYAQSLGISLTNYGHYMAYSFVIAFILAYFLGMLADRFHPLRGTIITVAVYGVMMLLAFFCISGEKTFAAALILQSVLCSTYNTISASLLLRLLPQDRFAQFSSAAGIITTGTNMITVPFLGFLLDCSGHDYRLLFLAASVLAGAAVIMGLVFYRQFQRHGGAEHYVAPVK